MSNENEITRILKAVQRGERNSSNELFPRRLATGITREPGCFYSYRISAECRTALRARVIHNPTS